MHFWRCVSRGGREVGVIVLAPDEGAAREVAQNHEAFAVRGIDGRIVGRIAVRTYPCSPPRSLA